MVRKLLQEFECVVVGVCCGQWIEAELLDVTAGDIVPTEIATINVDKIPEQYHQYLELGQVFTWKIYETESDFFFIVRYYTKEDIQRAEKRARELMEFFNHEQTDDHVRL